jgi:hypothetical protein
MLPCGQDLESAVAEFDHVFRLIPPQVRTGQDEGRLHPHPALNEPRTVTHSFRPKNDTQSSLALCERRFSGLAAKMSLRSKRCGRHLR